MYDSVLTVWTLEKSEPDTQQFCMVLFQLTTA